MSDLRQIHLVKRFSSYEVADRWLVGAGFKRIGTYEWRHKTFSLNAIINENPRVYLTTVIVDGKAPMEYAYY